jgi:hypothetical protein
MEFRLSTCKLNNRSLLVKADIFLDFCTLNLT